MKINNKFTSIWDELPDNSSLKKNKKVPENINEALELSQAAQKSVDNSVMKTWDEHNDMMKKSAELRKIKNQKDSLERKNLEHREEQREILAKIAIERFNNEKKLESEALKNS